MYLDTLNEDNCSHACALELGVISQYSGRGSHSMVSRSICGNLCLNVDTPDFIYHGARDWQRSNLNVSATVFISIQCCKRPEGMCVVINVGNIVSVSDKVCQSHNEVMGIQGAGYDHNRECDNVLGDTCGLSSRSLMWSFVFSSDRQYFTSYATSLVTLSGSKSKLSVTDILSGFINLTCQICCLALLWS